MMNKEIVFLLEEKSAEVMLRKLLPKIINTENVFIKYIVYEGKHNLKKRMSATIKGYQSGIQDTHFLLMCDRDFDDCVELKNDLLDKIPDNKRDKVLVRIACGELESFYLGDLQAVERGLNMNNLAKNQQKNKFRNPDTLKNASQELDELSKRKYKKVAGSRSIAPCLNIDQNKSRSFQVLCSGIKKLIT